MTAKKLLEFLNKKSYDTAKYVTGEECLEQLSFSEQEFVECVYALESEGHINVLKTRLSLPQVKISPVGKKYLQKTKEDYASRPSITYNVENMIKISGDHHGDISQSDNRVITVTKQLENLKSQIQMQQMMNDTKKDLLQKIDEIKEEFAQNQDPTNDKITSRLSAIGNIASELVPIISRFLGI